MTAVQYERQLILTFMAQMICSTTEEEEEVLREVMTQLEKRGHHDKVVRGCNLANAGPRRQDVKNAVLREILGPTLDKIVKALKESANHDLVEELFS